MLLEKELSEKNVYENIIEFGITNFEKSSSGVNKANEIITNIYTDLSEKCMKKKYTIIKKRKSLNLLGQILNSLHWGKNVNFWSRKMKLFPFDQNVKLKFLYIFKKWKGQQKLEEKDIKANFK